MPEHGELRGAAAEQHRHLVLELFARHQEAVFSRQLDGVAERADAARDDGNLVHRVGAGQRHRDQRVPHLVIGDDLALLGIKQAVALLQTRDHPLDRVGEIGHGHRIAAAAGRQQCRLVDEIGEVGAGEAGRHQFQGK